MSNPPPPLPAFDAQNPYRPPQGNALAMVSMILSIIALPMMCVFFIGLLPGLAAVVLGIVALVQIRKSPHLGRKGMAITGVALGGLCVLSGPLAIPIGLHFEEMANRSACAANLSSILKAAQLYSVSNNYRYPVVFGPRISQTYISPSVTGGPSGVPGTAGTKTAISGYYNASKFAAGDPMACLWILVISGNVSPKQFICKSDPAAPTASDASDAAGLDYYTFGETAGAPVHEAYSYSIAYPWQGAGDLSSDAYSANPVGAYWGATADSSLPIASDMAPLNNSGNPLKNVTTPKGGIGTPWVYNSNNHSGGEGQNVVYADAHVEFNTNPYIGQGGDNIWTTGRTYAARPYSGETQPTPTGSWGTATQGVISTQGTIPALPSNSVPYDLIFVPVRNASTNMQ